jgi:hypothetical protein
MAARPIVVLAVRFLALAALFPLAGCLHRGAASQAPAIVLERAHDAAIANDFLRIAFVPPNTTIATLGKAGALRVFFTSSAVFTPSVPLSQITNLLGEIEKPDQDLVLLRCHPGATAEPMLATWPSVFGALKEDLGTKPHSCDAAERSVEDKLYCTAVQFTDVPQPSAPESLQKLFNTSAQLVGTSHAPEAKWLHDRYGVFPAFTGLGFTMKDSYSLGKDDPRTSKQVLANSIVPEYLLKNVSLQEAQCSCVIVPPYPERGNGAVEPAFVEKNGGKGSCNRVSQLPKKRR